MVEVLPVSIGVVPACGNCGHWRQSGAVNTGTEWVAPFGQCLLSGKALQAPLVTTDRDACSGWVAK